MSPPHIAIIAAGQMGAAVAARLTRAGCSVYTNLDGRSEATKARAAKAGMQDVPFEDLPYRANLFLSVLPPSEAESLATRFVEAAMGKKANGGDPVAGRPAVGWVYADCNAISPVTVKRIAKLFEGTPVKFVDAGIIGGPPGADEAKSYTPTIYASAEPQDIEILDKFTETLNAHGLKIETLKGDEVGVGDASALKMSYAGMTKGLIGVFSTMILAAHASSPTTSNALLHELHASQPALLQRIVGSVPTMIPKAYRWVGEMEEISSFVGGGPGQIHEGLSRLYERIEKSRQQDGDSEDGDVGVLKRFVKDAKEVIAKGPN